MAPGLWRNNNADNSGGRRSRTGPARWPRIAAALLSLAVLAGWTVRGTEVDRKYYKVSGKTRVEAIASIRRNAPKAGRAYGIGFIDFFPDYKVAMQDGACHVETAQVGVRIALTLPRWDGPADAPASVVRFARHFVRTIDAHEMQHVAIASRYAGRMAAALRRLPPAADCWELRKRARETIALLKKHHIAAHRAFDERTRKQIKRLL